MPRSRSRFSYFNQFKSWKFSFKINWNITSLVQLWFSDPDIILFLACSIFVYFFSSALSFAIFIDSQFTPLPIHHHSDCTNQLTFATRPQTWLRFDVHIFQDVQLFVNWVPLFKAFIENFEIVFSKPTRRHSRKSSRSKVVLLFLISRHWF